MAKETKVTYRIMRGRSFRTTYRQPGKNPKNIQFQSGRYATEDPGIIKFLDEHDNCKGNLGGFDEFGRTEDIRYVPPEEHKAAKKDIENLKDENEEMREKLEKLEKKNKTDKQTIGRRNKSIEKLGGKVPKEKAEEVEDEEDDS